MGHVHGEELVERLEVHEVHAGVRQLRADGEGEDAAVPKKISAVTKYMLPMTLWSVVVQVLREDLPRLCGR